MVIYKGENVLFVGSLSDFNGLRMESKTSKHGGLRRSRISSDAGDDGATAPLDRLKRHSFPSRGSRTTDCGCRRTRLCKWALGRYRAGVLVYLRVHERGKVGAVPATTEL